MDFAVRQFLRPGLPILFLFPVIAIIPAEQDGTCLLYTSVDIEEAYNMLKSQYEIVKEIANRPDADAVDKANYQFILALSLIHI